MNQYLYETHLHTSEASACAVLSGAEQARAYKEAGYSGIIVTDHFFNGNSCIPRHLLWEERIDLFCKGYENAKAEGDCIGLDVFFGVEVNYGGTEFLLYGLDKKWMKQHPEMISWTVEEQFYKVHEAGGFVVHAHPYRIRPYIKEIRLFPEHVDAVEVYNVGNKNKDFDLRAEEYAYKHKLLQTAGTDSHDYNEIRSGIAVPYCLNSIQNFIDAIKNQKHQLIR